MLLTDEQREQLTEAVDAAEHDARFPTEALDLARASGLLSAEVSDATRSHVRDLRPMVQSIYEAGRVCASLGTIVSMHLQQVHAIAVHGTPRLKSDLAESLAAGKNYVGSITTERASGGDLRSSDSTIERRADTLVIDRDAPIVTGGELCDSFLVKVAEPGGGTSLVYVPREDAEVDIGKSSWDPMGMRESASVSLRLRATVPDWHVLGAPGQFDRIVSDNFGVFAHIGWAAAWLGTATECGNRLTQCIKEKPALRRKLADSDVMLARLSSARSSLDTVRFALDTVTNDYADGATGTAQFAIHTNELKVLASVKCFDAVDTMIEIGGLSLGYMRNPRTRLERAFRDLRSASLNFSNDKLAVANGKLIMRAGFGKPPSTARAVTR
ncbi:acyl-CoA dehydrogenase family protein [Nocardia callitridis]|uniref:Acyl-CoA dehydrogenase family protein n=1 Tax=Nocardia callitridis TaxID=648753 RepID=A0ABP9KAU2_9NOCA